MEKVFMIGSCAVLGFLMLPVLISAFLAFLLTGIIPGTDWAISPDVIILVSLFSLVFMIVYPQRLRIAAKLTRTNFRNRLPSKRFS